MGSHDTQQKLVGIGQLVGGALELFYGGGSGFGGGGGYLMGEGISNVKGDDTEDWYHQKGGFGKDVAGMLGMSSMNPQDSDLKQAKYGQYGQMLGGLLGGAMGGSGGGEGGGMSFTGGGSGGGLFQGGKPYDLGGSTDLVNVVQGGGGGNAMSSSGSGGWQQLLGGLLSNMGSQGGGGGTTGYNGANPLTQSGGGGGGGMGGGLGGILGGMGGGGGAGGQQGGMGGMGGQIAPLLLGMALGGGKGNDSKKDDKPSESVLRDMIVQAMVHPDQKIQVPLDSLLHGNLLGINPNAGTGSGGSNQMQQYLMRYLLGSMGGKGGAQGGMPQMAQAAMGGGDPFGGIPDGGETGGYDMRDWASSNIPEAQAPISTAQSQTAPQQQFGMTPASQQDQGMSMLSDPAALDQALAALSQPQSQTPFADHAARIGLSQPPGTFWDSKIGQWVRGIPGNAAAAQQQSYGW